MAEYSFEELVAESRFFEAVKIYSGGNLIFDEVMQLIDRSMELLLDCEPWLIARDDPSLKTYYKQDGSPINPIKVSGNMDVSMLNLLALLNELDLLEQVLAGIPGIDIEVVYLRDISRYEKIVQFIIRLPWPLSDRDIVIHIRAVDALSDGFVLFSGRSISTHLDLEIPQPRNGVERITINECAAMLSYMESLVHVTSVFYVNFNLPFVPQMIINYAVRHLPYYAFRALESNAKVLPAAHSERVYDDIGKFYQHIRSRLQQYNRVPSKSET